MPPASDTSRLARLGQRSVVMIASAKRGSAVLGELRGRAPGAARHDLQVQRHADHAGRGDAHPRAARRPSASATAAAIASRDREALLPSPTFALPLFTTTARRRARSALARDLHRAPRRARCA